MEVEVVLWEVMWMRDRFLVERKGWDMKRVECRVEVVRQKGVTAAVIDLVTVLLLVVVVSVVLAVMVVVMMLVVVMFVLMVRLIMAGVVLVLNWSRVCVCRLRRFIEQSSDREEDWSGGS
jgi:uncharacterized membrane protein